MLPAETYVVLQSAVFTQIVYALNYEYCLKVFLNDMQLLRLVTLQCDGVLQ